MKPVWRRAARFSGLALDQWQSEKMERYGSWLVAEGVRAGGIGPAESNRIDRRHLADSLLFASELPASAALAWDLGSGVGLPGVPLAIARPTTEFLLIDRSGRRVDLLRRVVRILDLDNCQVLEGEIANMTGKVDAIVSRASLPPGQLRPFVTQHLDEDGVAVVAGSWRDRPEHSGWETVEIPSYVLDQSVWLLIMRQE